MTPSMLAGLADAYPLLLLLAKATLILVAALGATFAMQRSSAGARHLVWLVALGSLLLVPALTAWAPLRVAILAAPSSAGAAPAPANAVRRTAPATVDAAPQSAAVRGTPRIVSAAPAFERSARGPVADALDALDALRHASPLTLLLALWGAVTLAIVASLAWSALVVRRIVRNGRALDGAGWRTPLYEVADRLGLDAPPRLLRSEGAKMPFACGLLKPTIVLPAGCDDWTLDRRRAVLLHELAHVRRHDLMGHTLGRFACAAYWFHPLVWTAAKRLRAESERACDDLALSCGTRATDYAEHLLDIVTSVRRDRTPSVALAMARRREFEGRMLAILDPELRHSTPSRRQAASLIATLALVSLTVGAATPVPRGASAGVARSAAVSPVPDGRELAGAPSLSDERDGVEMESPRVEVRVAVGTSDTIPKPAPRAEPVPEPRTRIAETPLERFVMKTVEQTIDATVGAVASAMSDVTGAGVRAAANAGVAAAVNAGLNASVNAGAGAGSRSAQAARRGADERPALLARVLRADTSATLRRVAAWGLNEYANQPVAGDALAAALTRDASAEVREMAAWSLADAREGTATTALVAALRGDASPRVRATAAWALGNLDDEESAGALAAALGDASSDVRLRAAWALGNVEPRTAPTALLAMLTDREPRMRQLAAWALFRIEDPASAPALQAALRNEADKDLQLAYIRALASLGERSTEALSSLLESPDPRVRSMAVRALAGGRAAGPWPWPWPEPRPTP